MKKIIFGFLVCLFSMGSASASVITVDFPSPTSTGASSFFFNAGQSVDETFMGTGINGVTELDLALGLADNALNSGGFVNFDVRINSTSVGSLTFTESDAVDPVLHNFNFSFSEIIGLGTYNIELSLTNSVPSGLGSVRFSTAISTATLTGDVSVPEPAVVLLLGSGLIGLIGMKKKSSATQERVRS